MATLPDLVKFNPWWRNAAKIHEDTKIKEFELAKAKWKPRIIHSFDLGGSKIYTLRGPRQVGKTTMLKLIVKQLLDGGMRPTDIFYYSCDMISSNKELYGVVDQYLKIFQGDTKKYIFIDEISKVRNWQHVIKELFDNGVISSHLLILTGSHSLDIRKHAENLPGRRGGSPYELDKIFLPMKFGEYVELRSPEISRVLRSESLISAKARHNIFKGLTKGEMHPIFTQLIGFLPELQMLFEEYMLTGGIPLALNEYLLASKLDIPEQVYSQYSVAVSGAFKEWNRSEEFLKRVVRRIFEVGPSPTSWRNLHEGTGIGSLQTLQDYVDLLENSFAISTIYPYDLSKEGPNYEKNKKFYFSDPFIFHALNRWSAETPHTSFQMSQDAVNSDIGSHLCESVVANHLVRLSFMSKNLFNPAAPFTVSSSVFYWRDKKSREVDFIARLHDFKLAIEVKYRNQLRPGDTKTIRSLSRILGITGLVLSKNDLSVSETHICLPVPMFLLFV